MSKIDDYRKFQADLRHAKCWADLIGNRYRGGGGGVGELREIKVEATVYHQESDGANNYHAAPSALNQFLAAEIRKEFPNLLAAAQAAMEAKRVTLAAEATAEHEELMRDAGLLTETAS